MKTLIRTGLLMFVLYFSASSIGCFLNHEHKKDEKKTDKDKKEDKHEHEHKEGDGHVH